MLKKSPHKFLNRAIIMDSQKTSKALKQINWKIKITILKYNSCKSIYFEKKKKNKRFKLNSARKREKLKESVKKVKEIKYVFKDVKIKSGHN